MHDCDNQNSVIFIRIQNTIRKLD